MILGAKFGVSQAFNICYASNIMLFPVSIVASVFGACNVFSRIATVLAPYVAEIKPEVISEWVFVVLNTLAFLVVFNLRVNTKKTKDEEEDEESEKQETSSSG